MRTGCQWVGVGGVNTERTLYVFGKMEFVVFKDLINYPELGWSTRQFGLWLRAVHEAFRLHHLWLQQKVIQMSTSDCMTKSKPSHCPPATISELRFSHNGFIFGARHWRHQLFLKKKKKTHSTAAGLGCWLEDWFLKALKKTHHIWL